MKAEFKKQTESGMLNRALYVDMGPTLLDKTDLAQSLHKEIAASDVWILRTCAAARWKAAQHGVWIWMHEEWH